MTSVANFLGNFQGGGLRPNRYRVVLSFPAIVGNFGAGQKIGFTCKAASIPATNQGVVEVPYMGRMVKLPGDKTFDDWSVTILLDNDLLGRGVFERWHDKMLAFDRNVAASVNPVDFMVDAEVRLLDRKDQVIDIYTVRNMFPSQVGEITLGYDQNDAVAEQQVTFAINGWSSRETT